MMSAPTPVPLDEIEARLAWYSGGDDAMRVVLSPAERDALVGALRIAVDTVKGARLALRLIADDEEAVGTRAARLAADGDAVLASDLAAVRELVDLGEKP